MLTGGESYLVFAAIAAVLFHILWRNYFRAVVAITAFCPIANLVHEAWKVDWKVNLAWAPFEFTVGAIMAFPIAVAIGIPIYAVRERLAKR
jgi:hypothetical protein